MEVFKNKLDVKENRHASSEKLSEAPEERFPKHVLLYALAGEGDLVLVGSYTDQFCDSGLHGFLTTFFLRDQRCQSEVFDG